MRFFIFRRKNFADKNSIGLFLNNTASKEEKQDYRFNFKFYKLKVYILLKQALNLFFKGGNQLGVRSPQVSSLDPPSLGTTKGLAPFGIPDYIPILIFQKNMKKVGIQAVSYGVPVL